MGYLVEGLELFIRKVAYTKYDATVLVRWSDSSCKDLLKRSLRYILIIPTGDFAVLLQTGMSIRKAVVYNIFSSVLSFIGMAVGVWVGRHESASLWIYAFTAGTFLYISLVDLVSMHTNYYVTFYSYVRYRVTCNT
jgi:hypothetical protein